MVILLILISIVTPFSHGQVIWIDGGLIGDLTVSGTYEYQELCFITGEPVLLKGLVKVPEVPKDKNKYTLGYSFELSNVEKGIELERKITFDVTKENNDSIKQTSYKKKLSSPKQYTETITTTNNVFTLDSNSFFETSAITHHSAIDYISGNVSAEKLYYIDGNFFENNGTVKYTIDAKPIVGYDHLYGSNMTYVIHQKIETRKKNPSYDANNTSSKPEIIWTGTVDIGMSSGVNVSFEKQYTDPQSIDIDSQYFQVKTTENVLVYKYVLPSIKDGVVNENEKKMYTGELKLSSDEILDKKSLNVTHIRDIGGHAAQEEIELLTSLQIFDIEKEYFVPNAPISRLEFAKAIVVATNGVLPETSKTEFYKRTRPGVETPYLDILPSDPDYNYIKYIKDNDIMSGKDSKFDPSNTITRSEAIAIMIRALGLQYKAPNPPYKTGFVDDNEIQAWAKDYIYVANEIGLITGTPYGQILPNEPLKKAEAAALITSFINHLKDNMRYDYREKILNR